MATSSGFSRIFALCCFVTTLIIASSYTVGASGDHHHLGWIPTRSGCRGSIAECLAGDEFDFDSEINRRILATSKPILTPAGAMQSLAAGAWVDKSKPELSWAGPELRPPQANPV
ncbi:hypothetical protein F0562_019935 [Nyssa sinensis]|uniref:Pectin acetylesterase n=1 Tax=Nyssa sinensis TaxID=561372 RepID=A0A5J5BRE6_9ASTE|nr:hypothetical protein F0562_019935 [Nyssa sinensis]